MPNKVQQDDIVKMNELYLQLKTYAAVSRIVGFSPTTVKRYIDPNFVTAKDLPYKKFSGVICDARFIVRPKSKEGWFEWLSFKEKEKNDCEELRKEILL